MKAAVLLASRDLRYQDFPTPQPKAGEVLIRVRAAGICGSDLPRVLGAGAHFYPVVLGHEFGGEIAQLGEGVEGLNVGDKVTAAPLKPCHECYDCKRGWYSLCKNYSFIGSREQGAFAEYVAVPAQNVVALSPDIPFESAALVEPITVALHGLHLMGFGLGRSIAIVGCGTIGLLTLLCARKMGARHITAVDISQERLDLAKQLGADAVCLSSDPEQVAAARSDIGRGFSHVVETAGAEAAFKTCLILAGNHAKIMLVGTPTRPVSFTVREFETINRKELWIGGSWMSYTAPFPGEEWRTAAKWLAEGLDVSPLIHKSLPLSKAWEGFSMFETPGAVKGKILLIPD